MAISRHWFTVVFSLGFGSIVASADPGNLVETGAKGTIQGFQLSPSVHLPKGLASEVMVIEGVYTPNGRTIACDGKRLNVQSDGKFTLELPFDKARVVAGQIQIGCFSVGDFGDAERGVFFLDVEGEGTGSRFTYFAGGGPSYSSFRFKSVTGNRANLKQTGIAVKGGINYQFPNTPYRAGLSAYAVPVKLWSEGSFSTAYYYGINARAGYRFEKKLWGHLVPEISLGWYIWGMSRSPPVPGVSNVYGPQFFATFYGTLENDRSYSFYVKYAPLSESFTFPKLTNQETAIGGKFSPRPLSKTSLTFDISELNGSFMNGTRDLSLYTASVGIERRF